MTYANQSSATRTAAKGAAWRIWVVLPSPSTPLASPVVITRQRASRYEDPVPARSPPRCAVGQRERFARTAKVHSSSFFLRRPATRDQLHHRASRLPRRISKSQRFPPYLQETVDLGFWSTPTFLCACLARLTCPISKFTAQPCYFSCVWLCDRFSVFQSEFADRSKVCISIQQCILPSIPFFLPLSHKHSPRSQALSYRGRPFHCWTKSWTSSKVAINEAKKDDEVFFYIL